MNPNQLVEVVFMGGPLDGEGYIHPLNNVMYLTVQDCPAGFYSIGISQPAETRTTLYWCLKSQHQTL